jgi:4-nitrophenyl phosphatase
VAGKPAPLLYEQAMEQMNIPPDATLVIGDRLDTDILGAVHLGIPTALVLTGITHLEELSQSMIHPTYVFNDLPSMLAAWCSR